MMMIELIQMGSFELLEWLCRWLFLEIKSRLVDFWEYATKFMMFIETICEPGDTKLIGNKIYVYQLILNLFLSSILDSSLSSSSD